MPYIERVILGGSYAGKVNESARMSPRLLIGQMNPRPIKSLWWWWVVYKHILVLTFGCQAEQYLFLEAMQDSSLTGSVVHKRRKD